MLLPWTSRQCLCIPRHSPVKALTWARLISHCCPVPFQTMAESFTHFKHAVWNGLMHPFPLLSCTSDMNTASFKNASNNLNWKMASRKVIVTFVFVHSGICHVTCEFITLADVDFPPGGTFSSHSSAFACRTLWCEHQKKWTISWNFPKNCLTYRQPNKIQTQLLTTLTLTILLYSLNRHTHI